LENYSSKRFGKSSLPHHCSLDLVHPCCTLAQMLMEVSLNGSHKIHNATAGKVLMLTTSNSALHLRQK